MIKLTGDNIFKAIIAIIAASAAIILLLNTYVLVTGSANIFATSGFEFISGKNWDPGISSFGVLPYILGTLLTSGIALLVGVPLSLGIAIFIVEMAPKTVRVPFSYLVEMLAAVPSVIYGLWGLFVLRFWVLNYIEKPLNTYLGWIPIFSGTPTGLDILTAGLILAIMIIPTVASVSREVISAVPNSIREGAYGIGATKWEVIRHWVINYGRSGIFGAIILGLGRAIGETMAVTMVIGNATGPKAMPTSLFQPGQTLPSLIANGFFDSDTPLQSSAYIGAGLVLLLISLLINVAAHVMVTRVLKVKGGAVE
ncbi:MAG: phosphate ABC transporter permease subunit PstC [Nitrososphaerota archaeon]|jgi:phosphate transport system permease protein|uniref:phosphate ABC transporter permease subunit PstC n=1 Tax=Candidatus Bathycorpusculum sp. TaxID=2994959 RepID=UPI00282465B7|nr:phosphate ABC transporter permease subunit PstC [Candidatus Termitimicrobium sp.]MCL2431081.1 phosphate ABC transporter permease subunit PstC [Candidatus Termitimicrobium sp.]MDR0492216.1 phosphate ABC transporter permease subunit PstC [Nitrososphaerota archaeon]